MIQRDLEADLVAMRVEAAVLTGLYRRPGGQTTLAELDAYATAKGGAPVPS
jgi:hypothetical protein